MSEWEYSPRELARLEAFQLVEDVQTFDTRDRLRSQAERAERRGWHEVRLVLAYAECVGAELSGDPALQTTVEWFIEQAERHEAPALMAAGLAMRAEHRLASESAAVREAGDADLARASALADVALGGALERATAHVGCGLAYGQLQLWELEAQHYAAAKVLLPECEVPLLEHVVLHNRTETVVHVACGLRETGQFEELAALRSEAQDALRAATTVDAPEVWQLELRVLGILTAGLVGLEANDDFAQLAAELEALPQPSMRRPKSYFRLACALRAADRAEWCLAADEARATLTLLEADPVAPERSLALRLAADAANASLGGERDSPLARYADHIAQRRWKEHQRALDSARARIQAEHLRMERDRHAEEALRDELTGIANRRAWHRRLAEIATTPGPRAVMVVDVDHFKQVNDSHGHGIGDVVLQRVAAEFAGVCRTTDLVARLGGDEFVALLEGASAVEVASRGDQLLRRLRSVRWVEVAAGLQVGVSVGTAAGTNETPRQLVERADQALYEAKRRGRSRRVAASEPDATLVSAAIALAQAVGPKVEAAEKEPNTTS